MKELCNRDTETSQVSIGSVGSAETVERFREKFLKEARLIACMDNNHIVRIHDIFEENGTAYYIMENVDGGSLEAMVNGRPIDEALALKYVREVADALKYIHAQNVLHLDVKPSNILIRKNGDAVLIDFGISKRYDEQGGQTSTTPAGISKGYAPTEQYNQGVANFSPATDIYSLGATLYKLLTGVTPPEASLLLNEDEELQKPDGISFRTWCAIEKAMEPRRKKRPQSIDEFLDLIGDAEPISSPNVTGTSEETIVVMPKGKETETSEETIIGQSEPEKEEPIVTEDEQGNLIFEVKGVRFKMIKVQGGTFRMGKTTPGLLNTIFGCDDLKHKVTITKTFYIAETTVTQELWEKIMLNNPSKFTDDEQLPVEEVSWNDCIEFIKKLNTITKKTFRLPTEAEWEFAAIGGIKSNHRQYSGSNNPNDVAWYAENSGNETHPVATKKANELGLHDMSGNVYEWCNDWYDTFGANSIQDPKGPTIGQQKVLRGGSWFNASWSCDSRHRNYKKDTHKSCNVGFRLALS